MWILALNANDAQTTPQVQVKTRKQPCCTERPVRQCNQQNSTEFCRLEGRQGQAQEMPPMRTLP